MLLAQGLHKSITVQYFWDRETNNHTNYYIIHHPTIYQQNQQNKYVQNRQ